MIDGILAEAPLHTRVVVVGVCMATDTLRPALAIKSEVDLRFVVGYTPSSSETPSTPSPTAASTGQPW